MTSPELASVSSEILKAVNESQLGGGKVLLVIDQLDLLLAAGGPGVGTIELGEALLDWREVRSISQQSRKRTAH